MEQDPLMLLDVDGVMIAELMSNKVAKKQGFRVSKSMRAELGVRKKFSRAHGAMLFGLAEHYGFELAWCTYWNDDANRWVGPAIGLPHDLPVIELPEQKITDYMDEWKYPSVLRYAKGRPLVWFDDEHNMHHGLWRDHFLAQRSEPTLLVDVSPKTGLTIGHLADAREWRLSLDDKEA